MRLGARMDARAMSSVLLAGMACGVVHHAALYAGGMRGYTSLTALLLTLTTEWPALIAALAVVRRLGGRPLRSFDSQIHGTTLFSGLMCALLVSAMASRLRSIDDEDAVAALLPIVPGQHMQSVGTAYMRGRTCLAPRWLPAAVMPARLQCFSPGQVLRVARCMLRVACCVLHVIRCMLHTANIVLAYRMARHGLQGCFAWIGV